MQSNKTQSDPNYDLHAEQQLVLWQTRQSAFVMVDISINVPLCIEIQLNIFIIMHYA